LGLDKDLVVPCAPAIELAPGKILLLITDGFSEAHARTGGMVGMTRILEVVHANRGKTAREIIEVLFRRNRDYTQCEKQDDDMTVVNFKRKIADGSRAEVEGRLPAHGIALAEGARGPKRRDV
jgi:serine phosphatase RsbU (regulator of sigma subunit)